MQGFSSVYKPRRHGAVDFAELLERVATAAPEMRIRFTSPHPKDFSDDVLQVGQLQVHLQCWCSVIVPCDHHRDACHTIHLLLGMLIEFAGNFFYIASADNVAQVIATHSNICKSLHMPAQSGSTRTLSRMKRGYTREAYDALIQRARAFMPHVSSPLLL